MISRLRLRIKQHLGLRRIVFTQVVALALILLMSQIFANFGEQFNESRRIKLGLIVDDQHPYVKLLIDSFTRNDDFSALFEVISGTQVDITAQFNDNQLDAYLIIPANFTENLLSYRANQLNIYSHLGFPTKAKILQALFASYSQYVQTSNAATLTLYDYLQQSNMSTNQIERANRQFSIEMIGIALSRNQLFDSEAIDALAGISSLNYFIVAISLALLGFSLIPIVDKTYQHLQSHVMQRLIISGQSLQSIVCDIHVVHVVSAAVSSVLLSWALAALIGINPLTFGLTLLAAAAIWSVLWLSIALVVNHRQLYFMICAIVAILLSAIGGSLTPFTIMPLHLKQLAGLSPVYALSQVALNIRPAWPSLLAWPAMTLGLFGLQLWLFERRQWELRR